MAEPLLAGVSSVSMTARRRFLAGALLLVAGGSLAWLGFGWRTETGTDRGTLRYQRVLGRAVILTVDQDADGRPEGRYVYSWLRPADQPHARPTRYREDRNGDGTWDTWIREMGPNERGEEELQFLVDLTGDGEPDWKFKSLDVLSGYQVIVEARGF
jgi:hypothetical protein